MTSASATWYAVGGDGADFRCATCHEQIGQVAPGLDHHPRACPQCGAPCAFLTWQGRVVQVVPAVAPPVVGRLLALIQREFDEIEYVELVAALQQLAYELDPAGQARSYT